MFNSPRLADFPKHIVRLIKAGDAEAFEAVFKKYYLPLLNLAVGILKEEGQAEEQVQEVFTKLWERRAKLDDDLRLFPYLLTSVRNRCYNYVRDQSVADKYVFHKLQEYRDQIFNDDYATYDDDVIEKLYIAIEQMPDKCREVFKLSRFEGLSHKQIAEKLSISTKTIENHITKAMKILKTELLFIIIYFISLLGDL